ncbi:SUMO-activating enzyme subunit 2 isoform X3 [Trichomycterus rosablanca]|uniref:SUMO-activating enzyme subunit 2 isoform X3 n=1 Tax=Trichomycterus rosablanca TaxID=2290929 RepID=UPI002F34FADC
MEAELAGPLHKQLADSLASCSVLVVGAGGIGCELLKNLVLTGFHNIEVIDLDTIDVSNLNRQFLFQKKHVGKSKAQVAKESVLRFCPSANITAYHDSIMNPDYNVEFFRKFQLVMNALDNRAARNHVNRMCLAADVPLIESGTAGYLGQVTVIKKGETECYECQPKPTQKTFPGCTIRNTPSEPIHCIVWAKYLFNQLFGEQDADQEVSPDTADPEAAWNPEDTAARATASDQDGDIKRVSTKDWARSTGYDAVKLFNKLFKDDIMYLLTMDKLWKKRKAPVPLDWTEMHKLAMAGNIIPAIATTNAVIAGLIVLEALKILDSDFQRCRTIFLNKQPNPRKKLLVPCALDRPNPNCYVCTGKPEVTVKLSVHKTIVLTLQDKILKEKFGMVAPDVQIEDGKGTILISSEEGETEANNGKLLSDFGIRNGSRLQADDFLQDYTLLVNVVHCEEMPKDVEFEVVGDAPEKAPAPSAPEPEKSITNGSNDSAQPSTSSKAVVEDDDVLIVDSDEEPSSSTADVPMGSTNLKRKLQDAETSEAGSKRKRLDQQAAGDDEDDDDIIALD